MKFCVVCWFDPSLRSLNQQALVYKTGRCVAVRRASGTKASSGICVWRLLRLELG